MQSNASCAIQCEAVSLVFCSPFVGGHTLCLSLDGYCPFLASWIEQESAMPTKHWGACIDYAEAVFLCVQIQEKSERFLFQNRQTGSGMRSLHNKSFDVGFLLNRHIPFQHCVGNLSLLFFSLLFSQNKMPASSCGRSQPIRNQNSMFRCWP